MIAPVSRPPFRVAQPADGEAVLRLMRTYYAEDGYPFDESASRRALHQLMEHAHLGRVWVATANGDLAAYLAVTLGFSLEYRGRDAFIDELYVAENCRGRGLGRAAVDLAVTWCRQSGVKALHLEVEEHRAAARKLYAQSGFELHGRRLMTRRLD